MCSVFGAKFEVAPWIVAVELIVLEALFFAPPPNMPKFHGGRHHARHRAPIHLQLLMTHGETSGASAPACLGTLREACVSSSR